MMPDVFYSSIDRKPVGMHIERRHEDAHLNGFATYEFRLFYRFDGNDTSIDRAYDVILAFAAIATLRTAEEVADEAIDKHRKGGQDKRQNYRREKKPHGDVDHEKHDRQQYQNIDSFVVDFHLLWLPGGKLYFTIQR